MRAPLLLAFAAALAFIALPAMAQESEIYVNSANGLAIGGYDPVAYFTEGEPVEGSEAFQTEWKGAP